MKKFSILILSFVFFQSAYAQKDFFDFINSFNWDKSESEIVEIFGSDIQKRKHSYRDYDKTMTDYEIVGIKIGDINCTASIYVDSISKEVTSLSFNLGDITKQLDANSLSNKMDSILFLVLGEPDKRKDEKGTYMGSLDRTWYKDNYILDVNHMVFSDSHIYSLNAEVVKNKGNDFRVAKWGDSKATIMEKEGKTDEAKMDRLYIFSDNVAGLPCDVAYIFTNNKLTMAKYMFKPSHTNKNDYIDDFKELVELMTKKYGEPDYNSSKWRNSLYKNDSDDYGLAISIGHLSYNAGWLGETTDVTVALYGENYKISLMIQYVSKKYEGLQQEKNDGDKLKDL